MLKPKNWILEQNLTNEQYQAVRCGNPIYSVERETEKAYKFVIETDFGKIWTWCPKSQVVEVVDFDELSDDELRAMDEEFDRAWEKGLAYNQSLVKFAKEHGIKNIRNRMRTETLINKIKEAGLTVPARA